MGSSSATSSMSALFALAFCALTANAANSPVADAAMRGDKAAVQALLRQKSDVNAPQPDGATAIQWASYRDDLDLAAILIAAGANVKTANREGATPMSLAAINGSAPMLEKLIQAGADPNEPAPHGETPLMFVARNGNAAAIQVLLNHNANVNAKEKLRGTTALMWAAEQDHPAAVKLLVAHGADLRAASNPDAKGGTAYLAPTPRQRAINDGIAPDGSFLGRRGGGRAAAPTAAPTAAPAPAAATAAPAPDINAADAAAADAAFNRTQNANGGGLTALVFAARQGSLDSARFLIEGGADVNQTTRYGWTPLLTAVQNRHYQLASYLLDHGADPNRANKGGWTPLYLATDNRNIEGGDYPVRAPDMDHLDLIKALLDHGANVNARVCGVESTPQLCKGDSTETRTIFTMQWLYEDGATPFLRAAQSGDVDLMKLLLARGADPKIATSNNTNALMVAAGVGWVEGVTFEWSEKETLEAVKMCLDLGIDPNVKDDEGRTSLHGAAHKGRPEVIQLLVDHGANLEAHDGGSRDSVNGAMLGKTWIPLDWSRGLVRVGVQSAIPHPEAEKLLLKLMTDRGMPIPPPPASSICLTKGVNGCQ